MTGSETNPSPRRQELLEAAYAYALRSGLTELSLRPLAEEIQSSPRVLLYLFGSKDGLIRALLARARADELAVIREIAGSQDGPEGLQSVARELWRWLSDAAHRGLLTLWVESYARSLTDPDGPWAASPAIRSTTGWRCSPPGSPPNSAIPRPGSRSAPSSSQAYGERCWTCSPLAIPRVPPRRCTFSWLSRGDAGGTQQTYARRGSHSEPTPR